MNTTLEILPGTKIVREAITDWSRNKTARIAGLFYLLYILASIIADQLGHLGFGDAAAIIDTIITNNILFRVSFVIGLLSAALFLLAAWALYALLKTVNPNLALMFLLLNLGGFAIWCFSMLNVFASMLLLSGADYLTVFSAEQLRALAMLFANIYKNGTIVAQIPYGLWVLPLGYLIYKSGFLPKALGIVLMVDFAAIFIWFFQFFLLPSYPMISYPCYAVGFFAEFGLSLWLLIKGVKDQK